MNMPVNNSNWGWESSFPVSPVSGPAMRPFMQTAKAAEEQEVSIFNLNLSLQAWSWVWFEAASAGPLADYQLTTNLPSRRESLICMQSVVLSRDFELRFGRSKGQEAPVSPHVSDCNHRLEWVKSFEFMGKTGSIHLWRNFFASWTSKLRVESKNNCVLVHGCSHLERKKPKMSLQPSLHANLSHHLISTTLECFLSKRLLSSG